MDRTRRPGRAQLAPQGTFVTVPALFHSADDGLGDGVKLEVGSELVERRDTGKPSELSFRTTLHSDRLLVDFAAVEPEAVDLARVRRDCELLIDAIDRHPDVLRAAVDAVTGATQDQDEIRAATERLAAIRLTEEHTHEDGGGIVGLLVAVGVALLCAGCYGCAHCQGTTPPPATPADVHLAPADAGAG